MRAAWIVGAAVVMVAPVRAWAQEDVPALIKLVDEPPAGMDRTAWKEKRRDAAKKLVASGDKRAVPVLMKVAESETFDIIGEIAIDGLGTLGDPQAVPVLQRIEADPSRDRGQRDKARKALAKLGSKPSEGAAAENGATTGTTTEPGTGAGTGTGTGGSDLGSVLLGGGNRAVPEGPTFDADVLAEVERVTFAVGGAHLGYDTVRQKSTFDADVTGAYERRVDKESLAFGYGGSAHVLAGYINNDGPSSSRGAQIDLRGRGEVRTYFGPGTYAIAELEAAHQTTYESVVANDGSAERDVRNATEIQLGIGGGYGRVLEVGSLVRVRRIAAVLEENRALGKPIDAATARRLASSWWALRGTRSLHPVLVATVAILRENGVLLGEPDAGLTYELLEVLRDGQLDDRLQGIDVHLLFGEGYLSREDMPMIPTGRLEQVLLEAAYATQLPGDTAEAGGSLWAKQRLFADMNTPSPWSAGATARWRRFFYGEFADPAGALDIHATVGASDDDTNNTDLGFVLGGGAGWTFRPNRASWLRVGADVRLDSGEVFFGASLEASYGLVTGSFARM